MGVANRGFHKEVSAARMLFRMWEAALLKKGASPKPLSSQNGKRGEFRALRSTARGSSPLDSRKLLKKFDQNFCLGIAGYEYKNRNLSTPASNKSRLMLSLLLCICGGMSENRTIPHPCPKFRHRQADCPLQNLPVRCMMITEQRN